MTCTSNIFRDIYSTNLVSIHKFVFFFSLPLLFSVLLPTFFYLSNPFKSVSPKSFHYYGLMRLGGIFLKWKILGIYISITFHFKGEKRTKLLRIKFLGTSARFSNRFCSSLCNNLTNEYTFSPHLKIHTHTYI